MPFWHQMHILQDSMAPWQFGVDLYFLENFSALPVRYQWPVDWAVTPVSGQDASNLTFFGRTAGGGGPSAMQCTSGKATTLGSPTWTRPTEMGEAPRTMGHCEESDLSNESFAFHRKCCKTCNHTWTFSLFWFIFNCMYCLAILRCTKRESSECVVGMGGVFYRETGSSPSA